MSNSPRLLKRALGGGLLTLGALGWAWTSSAQDAGPPKAAAPKAEVPQAKNGAAEAFLDANPTPDEVDARAGLFLHVGRVNFAEDLLSLYYENRETLRTPASYALEGEAAILRVQLGVTQIGRSKTPSELLDAQLRVLRTGALAVERGLACVTERLRESRMTGEQVLELRVRLLALRARLYLEIGDAAYRIKGASVVAQGLGSQADFPAATEYVRARNAIYEALLLEDRPDLVALGQKVDQRLSWYAKGLPFGGRRYFEHEPYMDGGPTEHWAVRPRLEALLEADGELEQLYRRRLERLEQASEAANRYILRLEEDRERGEYRRRRQVMHLQDRLARLATEADDVVDKDLRHKLESLRDAAATFLQSEIHKLALKREQEDVRAQIDLDTRELAEVMAALVQTASAAALAEGDARDKRRAKTLDTDLGQAVETGKKVLGSVGELERLLSDFRGGRRVTKLDRALTEIERAQARVEEVRESIEIARSGVDQAVAQLEALVARREIEELAVRKRERLAEVERLAKKDLQQAEDKLREFVEEEIQERVRGARAKVEEAREQFRKIQGFMNDFEKHKERVEQELQLVRTTILAAGSLVKGTGTTTISSLPDAIMNGAKIAGDIIKLGLENYERVQELRQEVDKARAWIEEKAAQLRALDGERLKKIAEQKLEDTKKRWQDQRGEIEHEAFRATRDLLEEQAKLVKDEFESKVDAAEAVVDRFQAQLRQAEAVFDGRNQEAEILRQEAADLAGRAHLIAKAIIRGQKRLAALQETKESLKQWRDEQNTANADATVVDSEQTARRLAYFKQEAADLMRQIETLESGSAELPMNDALELSAVAQGRPIMQLNDAYADRVEEANRLLFAYSQWLYRVTGDRRCLDWGISARDHFQLGEAFYQLDQLGYLPLMRRYSHQMPRFFRVEILPQNLPRPTVGLAWGQASAVGSVAALPAVPKWDDEALEPAALGPLGKQIWFELSTFPHAGGLQRQGLLDTRTKGVDEAAQLPVATYLPLAGETMVRFPVAELSETQSGGFLWDAWVTVEWAEGGQATSWVGLEPVGPTTYRERSAVRELPIFTNVYPDHAAKTRDPLAPVRQYEVVRESLGRDVLRLFGQPTRGHNYPEYMARGLDGTYRLVFSDPNDLFRFRRITVTFGYFVSGQTSDGRPMTDPSGWRDQSLPNASEFFSPPGWSEEASPVTAALVAEAEPTPDLLARAELADSLGVTWESDTEWKINTVRPNGAAAKAGLTQGQTLHDRLAEFLLAQCRQGPRPTLPAGPAPERGLPVHRVSETCTGVAVVKVGNLWHLPDPDHDVAWVAAKTLEVREVPWVQEVRRLELLGSFAPTPDTYLVLFSPAREAFKAALSGFAYAFGLEGGDATSFANLDSRHDQVLFAHLVEQIVAGLGRVANREAGDATADVTRLEQLATRRFESGDMHALLTWASRDVEKVRAEAARVFAALRAAEREAAERSPQPQQGNDPGPQVVGGSAPGPVDPLQFVEDWLDRLERSLAPDSLRAETLLEAAKPYSLQGRVQRAIDGVDRLLESAVVEHARIRTSRGTTAPYANEKALELLDEMLKVEPSSSGGLSLLPLGGQLDRARQLLRAYAENLNDRGDELLLAYKVLAEAKAGLEVAADSARTVQDRHELALAQERWAMAVEELYSKSVLRELDKETREKLSKLAADSDGVCGDAAAILAALERSAKDASASDNPNAETDLEVYLELLLLEELERQLAADGRKD